MNKIDIFQQRYLKHRERKSKTLMSGFGTEKYKKYNKKEQDLFFKILKNRASQRAFNDEPIEIKPILEAIETSPSSCNRKGVSAVVIEEKNDKELLSGLLVGGIGWINKAKTILLLIADMNCYKSPAEKSFMPYLDAGFIGQTAYLACEALNYGVCFINPNIRQENKEIFKNRFHIKDNELFCGALVIGKYNKKHI